MDKSEKRIKSVFNEHISRVGQWPPSWSDVEDAIREAYWAGAASEDEEDEEDVDDLVEDAIEGDDFLLDKQ